MKLTSSFAALSSVVVIALCLGQAQADTVTTPLGLTQVDDKGVPITPLTYLNLEPASKELAGAAKKVTTPPPMIKEQKRLLPSDSGHLEPVVESFTSPGLSLKRESLIPSLPLFGSLDNEGDFTNAKPAATAPAKRLIGPLEGLEALKPGEGTEYLPPNHQELGQRTVHPLNRRDEDNPVDISLLGQGLPKLSELNVPTKLPGSKRGKNSGLNIFGTPIPINAIELPGLSQRDDSSVDLGDMQDLDTPEELLKTLTPTKRQETAPVKPLDLGLKTGNEQDLDNAKSLLGGLLPIKRDEPSVQPLDLGLKTGNEQDLERAKSLLGGLLGGKRDTISPDNVDLSSVKSLSSAAAEAVAKNAVPVALTPIKQEVSPVVQVVKTANQVCNDFGCETQLASAVQSIKDKSPIPLPSSPAARALGEKDLFAHGLLNNQGQVEGIPLRRDQDPLVQNILDTSDEARDAILGVKTTADNAAGEFVKNMYSKHGEVTTKRAINIPGYAILPGAGPPAKAALKELIDFTGLNLPGGRRMEKVRRK